MASEMKGLCDEWAGVVCAQRVRDTSVCVVIPPGNQWQSSYRSRRQANQETATSDFFFSFFFFSLLCSRQPHLTYTEKSMPCALKYSPGYTEAGLLTQSSFKKSAQITIWTERDAALIEPISSPLFPPNLCPFSLILFYIFLLVVYCIFFFYFPHTPTFLVPAFRDVGLSKMTDSS